ncbi:MAG: YceI family protein [Acidobacteriota bacterium]|nr:YceI family protein [Acidobacteriota bacterium]
MRRSLLILAALLLLAQATALSAADKTFTPDTIHSRIGFSAKTLFKVEGNFGKYTTDISGDPDTLENAKVRVEIEVASINTENKSRDGHLKSPDFFDAAKYPKIVFSSSKVWKQNTQVMVEGTLDMHGVKKEVTLAFEPSFGKNGAGADTWSYEGSLKINRNDWSVGSGSIAAKIGLKDTVELNLQLVGFFHEKEAAKPAPAKAPAKKHKKAA